VLHGFKESYYENGQLQEKLSYEDGELGSLTFRYEPDGRELLELICCDDGKATESSPASAEDEGEGVIVYRKKATGELFSGKVEFYTIKDKELFQIANVENGLQQGEWTYLSDGKIKAVWQFKNGKEDGLGRHYNHDGSFDEWCYKQGQEVEMSYCEENRQ